MIKTKINAEIVGHSLSPQGDELISVLCTFPRIILAEVNTHRMLSKNTSSSRAIPFEKMVEAVQNNLFIPIAWQKEHKGMQGSEYITDEVEIEMAQANWNMAKVNAIDIATSLNKDGITKQLCNRLLEPFMWTTMLITGSKEGWQNFFSLRCPQYVTWESHEGSYYKSKKDYTRDMAGAKDWTDIQWLKMNKGQAEIHMMALAESIYDAVNESTPKQLKAGEWHIPFEDKINIKSYIGETSGMEDYDLDYHTEEESEHISRLEKEYQKALVELPVKISVAMAARTSYTVVGEEKEIDYSKMIELHDRLLSQDPPHSSPLEHCARAMSEVEYTASKSTGYTRKGEDQYGWCNNLKGFIPYRYMIDNNLI